MLKNAMARLKFPIKLINLIAGLFLNRKNQVFTSFGNTDFYDVQVGIDQGEVISPILWVIYYDPLFQKIKDTGLGFKMEATWNPDINKSYQRSLQVTIPAVAYMDDTIWTANSYDQMNNILNIAQSFYNLNSMKVNFDKSCIIMDNDSNVPITFQNVSDNSIFTCSVIPNYESMRYLRIWISTKYNKNFIKKQLSSEISSFKPLT